MKTIVRVTVSISLGAALGWYLGFTRLGMKTDRGMGPRLAKEVEDSNAALNALHAIHLAEAGDKQELMAYLAKPVGWFYRAYGGASGASAERMQLRADIERLASSNAVVAAEISKKSP